MQKKIALLLTILCIFFIPIITNAADGKLKDGDIEMECVYDNGRSFSFYYTNNSHGISISTFKLANAATPPYSTSLSFFYNEGTRAKEILDSVSCPTSIQSTLIEQKNKSGDSETSIQFEVFFVGSDAETVMTGDVCSTTKFVAGFSPTSGRLVPIEVEENSVLGKRVVWSWESETENTKKAASFQFNLVSERIYFINDVQPKRQWAFKSEGQQAASKANYISVSEYVNAKGTAFKVIEKNDFITRTKSSLSLNTNDEKYTHYICLKPSTMIVASDRNDMAYTFTVVKHDASWKNRVEVGTEFSYPLTCTTGYSLYQEVSWEEFEENATNATSICEVMPETSLMIATAIYYLGMIVPALLIIFTAIDISKLVISGNLDEELPKKKKLIMVRFIVAVCFFFLPLLVQLFVNSNYGIDFGDISCLFTTGEEVPDESATDAETGDETDADEATE